MELTEKSNPNKISFNKLKQLMD